MSELYYIGEKIKEIRKSRKISQEKLAELTNTNFRTISRIETSRNLPSLETLEKIAGVLNVEVKDFFENSHLEKREILISDIQTILNKLSDSDLQKFYKIVYNFYN